MLKNSPDVESRLGALGSEDFGYTEEEKELARTNKINLTTPKGKRAFVILGNKISREAKASQPQQTQNSLNAQANLTDESNLERAAKDKAIPGMITAGGPPTGKTA